MAASRYSFQCNERNFFDSFDTEALDLGPLRVAFNSPTVGRKTKDLLFKIMTEGWVPLYSGGQTICRGLMLI